MARHSLRRSPFALNILLAAGSVAIALVLAELVLRTFRPVHGMIYALGDRYLFRQIPGSRKLDNPIGETWSKVLVRVNAVGRRGDELSLARAARWVEAGDVLNGLLLREKPGPINVTVRSGHKMI